MSTKRLKRKYNGHGLYRVIPDPRYLTLLTNGYGTLLADALSGYSGSVVHLTATPDDDCHFIDYDSTACEIVGDDLTFSNSDCTAQANFGRNVHNVTTLTSNYGSISVNKNTGYSGDIFTLSNTPNADCTFGSYSITGATLTSNQFMMEKEDVSAQGSFNRNVHNVTLQNDGKGTITSNKNTGYSGDTITLSNTPNAGYGFSGYAITGATLTSNQFKIGTSNVTAKAFFSAVPTIYYTDDNTYTATSPKTININKVLTSTKYTVVQFEYKVNGRNGNYFQINPAEIAGVCTGNYHPIGWPNINIAVPTSVYGIQSIWSNNAYYHKTLVGSAWAKHKFIYGRKNQGIGHDQTDIYINNTFMGDRTWNNGWYVSANSAINSITISGNNAQFTTTTASIRNIRIVGFNDLAAATAYNG